MNSLVDTLRIIAQIALRNLFASRLKTLIVGGIIAFGAAIVVMGTSLVDSIDLAMSQSIRGSLAGDIQVYSSESKEVLDVFGGFGPSGNDIAPVPDFQRVKTALLTLPNVADVVPMGIDGATVAAGNSADQALAKLREQVAIQQSGSADAPAKQLYVAQKDRVRQIVRALANNFENVKKVRAEGSEVTEDLQAVQQANQDSFWQKFDTDPLNHLEFLENKIAPLANDSDMLYFRYLGTDPQRYEQAFRRMRIVEGQNIPAGHRGFLLSKYVYEEQIKLRTARILDKLRTAREVRHERIAEKPELQRLVKENTNLTQELILQLDSQKTELFRSHLQALLNSTESDVELLLKKFFLMDDSNFDQRYRFYYDQLAPEVQLYKIRVGDTLTIKAYTRSGYVKSANLRVYGVFAFQGLEQSPQAGTMNLMDLVSFRELYGYMTPEREQEIRDLRAQSGATDVSRENAEQELFGSAQAETSTAVDPKAAIDASARLSEELAQLAGRRTRSATDESPFDATQLEQGVVLNAAVLLRDGRRVRETVDEITALAAREHLSLKALPWHKAVGVTGQFTMLMRAVLYTTVAIIFVVAMIIINNALVMATLERVREFGTLRAIGAQRRFIWAMIVLESVVTGLLFGVFGLLLGGAVVSWLAHQGLPAWNDVVTFFFSGPRLFPQLSGLNLAVGLVAVICVSVFSSAYPAWIAMRVSPRQAMQSEE